MCTQKGENMQKIFTKYISCVVTIALLTILVLNWVLLQRSAREQMVENSVLKLDQIARTLENNEVELKNLKESLDEDYLTRAYAFAYIVQQNPDVLNSQGELEQIAKLLNVDELHVIDENGILFAGSIPKYFGMDFHDTDQTKEFLSILDDPESYLVQDIRPNGYEQKVFQYIGVARKDQKGIVQVGMAPDRMLEAQKKNQLDYILSRMPVDSGSLLFAIEGDEETALVNTDQGQTQKKIEDLGLKKEKLDDFYNGKFGRYENGRVYYVVRRYGDILLGVGQTEAVLYVTAVSQTLLTAVFLLLTCLIVIWVLNRLLKRQIVDGIHTISDKLSEITEGNLNTVVQVESNPEFKQLSLGINKMVQGILDATVRVSQVIDMVDMPIGVFEIGKDVNQVMATERLRSVLGWTEEEASRYTSDRELFWEKLQQLMSRPMEGESNIFCICTTPQRWVRIQTKADGGSVFGVAADVTEDIREKIQIEHERDYDSLTGLCNIDTFKKEVEGILEQGNPAYAAMIMMDLDNFKGINDQYGHDWGDEYLKKFSEILCAYHKEHGIAARRSGDEFCLFLHHFSSKAQIANCMEEFYGKLKEYKVQFPDNNQQEIRVSAGLAWYGDSMHAYGTLMKAADYALYDAKNSGKAMLKQYSLE